MIATEVQSRTYGLLDEGQFDSRVQLFNPIHFLISD